MATRILILLLIVIGSRVTGRAQAPAVTVAFAALTKSIDSQKAEVGQQVQLKLIRSVVADGKVLLPRDTPVTAHVSKIESEGKRIMLSLVLDQAVPDGHSAVPLQGIIVAMAKEENHDLAADPQASMMRSLEPKTGSSTSSSASSGAAVATAQLGKEGSGPPLNLRADSQGVSGYDNVTLSWELKQPPPATVISAKSKRLVLAAGTQVLLRMATPRVVE